MRTILYILSLAIVGCTPSQNDTPGLADIAATNAAQYLPKGKLFIIGGGRRPDAMVERMVQLSVCDTCYALVFADASSEPDSSFYFINRQMQQFTQRPIELVDAASFASNVDYTKVLNASLIFITGGDQNRFLEKVDSTARQAIKEAYQRGAMVAGTSAGAALMSKIMITGDQHLEPEYEETYSRLFYKNGDYAEGLGLIENAIVDQHFITRSRYNRLLSALADTGVSEAFGVEESTALLITPQYCTVIGDNQVARFQKPASFSEKNGRIGFREMKINMYLEGDTFSLNPTQ